MTETPLGVGETRRKRSRFLFVVLILGVGLAIYFGNQAPKEQHVRFVLGNAASEVTALDCDYENADGVARSAKFAFDPGAAPRIVAHDPKLSNGDYTLAIRLFSKTGQNTIEKRVRLEEGTVSIELASAVPTAPSSSSPSDSPSSSTPASSSKP